METTVSNSYLVTGNTYNYRDTIKRLGGEWNGTGWVVDSKAAEYLSKPANFGRRAIRQGTGLEIRPIGVTPAIKPTAVTPAAQLPCRHCGTYCYDDCTSSKA